MNSRIKRDAATVTGHVSRTRRRLLRAAWAPFLMAGVGALPAIAPAANNAKKRVETPGKTWLEVSLNGPWSRDRQPGIPISTFGDEAWGMLEKYAGPLV